MCQNRSGTNKNSHYTFFCGNRMAFMNNFSVLCHPGDTGTQPLRTDKRGLQDPGRRYRQQARGH